MSDEEAMTWKQSVALDANVLLLLIVGRVGREKVSQFKRTRMFSEPALDDLLSAIATFRRIIVTPNTVTEADNLLPHDDFGDDCRIELHRLLDDPQLHGHHGRS